jgi:hypothetical protein
MKHGHTQTLSTGQVRWQLVAPPSPSWHSSSTAALTRNLHTASSVCAATWSSMSTQFKHPNLHRIHVCRHCRGPAHPTTTATVTVSDAEPEPSPRPPRRPSQAPRSQPQRRPRLSGAGCPAMDSLTRMGHGLAADGHPHGCPKAESRSG